MIGSAAGDSGHPTIITNRCNLEVRSGAVANFSTYLTMVNAGGAGCCTIKLSNLTATEIIVNGNGTALVIGTLDVTVNCTDKIAGIDTTITLSELRALNMTLREPDYLDELIYGTGEPQEETTITSTGLLPAGSGIYGNITEKFRPPQLQNPFN